ncbi:MAG TPA: hypothetical protein VLY24_23530 [Bryobacteraceae bacterium]|nr:hypothetical protein [Bryobacteraceae bacterium]
MAKVIVIAQVQDPVKWEAGFRTHGDLFRSMKVRDAMHYAINGNEITVFCDVESLETFQKVMESQATADAMAVDGVKRETVKTVVIDKEMKLSTGAASGR